MTFPPGLTTIEVTGLHITALDGTPLSGNVIFSAAAEVTDPAVSDVLEGSAIGEVLNGTMTPIIIATTDCVSPPFTYTITQRLVTPDGVEGSPPPVPGVSIPASLGVSVDLSALL